MDTIYRLLRASKKVAIATYNILLKFKGLNCVVSEPVSQESIFGLEDVTNYDELVKKNRKLLLYGIFQEGMQGMQEFDTFIEGAYALTLWNDKLPLQTQIEVEFCGNIMTFKVDEHRNVQPSVCGQTFIKNMLVPAT